MPSGLRIIRNADNTAQRKIQSVADTPLAVPQDHVMRVEKEAFEQGYREGERIGKQMGERMIDSAIRRYEKSLADVVTAQRSLAECMQKEAVKLAIEIARRIVRRELTVDPDLLLALASVAVKRVSGQSLLVLRVGRADVDRIRESVHQIHPGITVQEDPSLERGDFILDTDRTHVDGRVGTEIDAVSRTLLDLS